VAPQRAPPPLTHHLARWKLWAGIVRQLVWNLGETRHVRFKEFANPAITRSDEEAV
jgi:hypothetical protein